jgi:uncharacterized protein (DUF433 family)
MIGDKSMITTPVAVDVPLYTDEEGVIRVRNTRVTLLTLVAAHNRGDTPSEIHEGFPAIPLADIYAVLAYYLSHQSEVDDYIQHIKQAAEQRRHERERNDSRAIAFNEKMHTLRDEKNRTEQS